MSRKKKNFDNPNQLTVHDWIQRVKKERGLSGPAPGSMDIETEFRAAISEAIKNCELNAYMIAGKMSELTGNVITEPMVYSWSRGKENDNKPTNFPAKYLGVFCRITGSKSERRAAVNKKNFTSNSFSNGIEVLKKLSHHPEPVNLATLVAEIGFPKSTIFRILQTLCDCGMIVKDGDKYLLGPEAALLWLNYRRGLKEQETKLEIKGKKIKHNLKLTKPLGDMKDA